MARCEGPKIARIFSDGSVLNGPISRGSLHKVNSGTQMVQGLPQYRCPFHPMPI